MSSFGQKMVSRFVAAGQNSSRTRRAGAITNSQPEILKMKKMILFAAMFGLAAALTAKGAEAKDNWDANCAKCHGADGKGDTKMGTRLGCKDFTDAAVQAGIKDDEAFNDLKNGMKSDDGKTLMKPFGDQLSDDEIKALVAYVHTLKK
jgi:cytochrome c6